MRIAIYVRVSTQHQAQTQTIEQQIERLKAHIATQGWQLDPEQVYRDDGYSGSKLNRPGLDSLRDHARLAEFDHLLITAPDRLARNYVHQVLLIEELEQRGIPVEFLDRPMSSDPHDQLLLQIRGAVAEYERTLIADRMWRGRQTRYRSGKLTPWPRSVYGYRFDPDHPRDPTLVQLDPTESAMVKQIFAWYLADGNTLYLIAKRLTDLSMPSPYGKPRWNASSVRGILKNPAYTGTTYANRSRPVPAKIRKSAMLPIGRGQSLAPRPPEDWIPINVPAIVEQVVYDQVQARLAHNQQTSPRNNTMNEYLLRGLISCGQCHLSATGKVRKGGYRYYVCRGHTDSLRAAQGQRCIARYAPADQLDQLVWQDLCQVLIHPEMIAYALERAHGGHWLPQELQAQIEALQKASKQLEHQQERLLEAYLADIVKLSELERKRNELSRKQEALRLQISQLQTQADHRMELSKVTDSIEVFCAQVRPILDLANFAQKRQLVELLVDHVIISDENVEIHYVIPTHPEGPHLPFCHLRTDYRV